MTKKEESSLNGTISLPISYWAKLDEIVQDESHNISRRSEIVKVALDDYFEKIKK